MAKETNCTIPVRGPSTGLPAFSPETDDCGFYIEYQSLNNCYDYGTDVVTNTFAQPGRGTGQKWKQNTCEAMTAAAESDGLVHVGTNLPSAPPTEGGHYVSLHIWPSTNFHWTRMNSNVTSVGGAPVHTWSHKPGGTAVRGVDNDGKTIIDPRDANLNPWSQFCAFFLVNPSTVKIN